MTDTEIDYSLDTSWLLNLENHYPIDLFPPVWENVSDLLLSGRAYIINFVAEEIADKDDVVARWIKSRGEGVIKQLTDEELLLTQSEVLARYPQWVDVEATKDKADPFVVGEAIVRGSVVVTHEVPVNSMSKKAKIPNACAEFGVRSIHGDEGKPGMSHTKFFREMGWKF